MPPVCLCVGDLPAAVSTVLTECGIALRAVDVAASLTDSAAVRSASFLLAYGVKILGTPALPIIFFSTNASNVAPAGATVVTSPEELFEAVLAV